MKLKTYVALAAGAAYAYLTGKTDAAPTTALASTSKALANTTGASGQLGPTVVNDRISPLGEPDPIYRDVIEQVYQERLERQAREATTSCNYTLAAEFTEGLWQSWNFPGSETELSDCEHPKSNDTSAMVKYCGKVLNYQAKLPDDAAPVQPRQDIISATSLGCNYPKFETLVECSTIECPFPGLFLNLYDNHLNFGYPYRYEEYKKHNRLLIETPHVDLGKPIGFVLSPTVMGFVNSTFPNAPLYALQTISAYCQQVDAYNASIACYPTKSQFLIKIADLEKLSILTAGTSSTTSTTDGTTEGSSDSGGGAAGGTISGVVIVGTGGAIASYLIHRERHKKAMEEIAAEMMTVTPIPTPLIRQPVVIEELPADVPEIGTPVDLPPAPSPAEDPALEGYYVC